MADDDSSELSSLSSLSPAPSEDESGIQLKKQNGILRFFHKLPKQPAQTTTKRQEPAAPKEPTPPPRKRSPSPEHEYILADNPDIAFIIMFRSRFNDALPKSLPNFGPQDIEQDVTEVIPGERVELFLCAVLGLLLNRKQDVKTGHYNRALEDAISARSTQWPTEWGGQSPLAGGATFTSMNPEQRLTLLRTLVHWALGSSDAVRAVIATSYKQLRHDDDLNQPLSVQPWGSDGDRRRYYLVEGLDDTSFRVYRESNPAGFNRTWRSVAGSIDEIKALADRLVSHDGGPKAVALAHKINAAIPRFEATEEKRRRREYRQLRKLQFKRPQPGFSLYEGRTRGKRIKYTYSDDEDEFLTEDSGTRRSTRNATGTHTPAESSGPVVTASGRHVRQPSRLNNNSIDGASTGTRDDDDSVDRDRDRDVDMKDGGASEDARSAAGARPRRSAAVNHGSNGWAAAQQVKGSAAGGRSGRKLRGSYDSELSEEDGTEPDFGDDEDEDEHVPDETDDEDDDMAGAEEFDEGMQEIADDEDDEDEDGGKYHHHPVRPTRPKKVLVTLPIRVSLDANGIYGLRKAGGGVQKAVSSRSYTPEPRTRSEDEINVALTTASSSGGSAATATTTTDAPATATTRRSTPPLSDGGSGGPTAAKQTVVMPSSAAAPAPPRLPQNGAAAAAAVKKTTSASPPPSSPESEEEDDDDDNDEPSAKHAAYKGPPRPATPPAQHLHAVKPATPLAFRGSPEKPVGV